MEKHQIYRVYCCPDKVKNGFAEQWKSKNLNEKEESDDIAFWYQHKDKYLEHLPNHEGVFEFNDEVEDDKMVLWRQEETL